MSLTKTIRIKLERPLLERIEDIAESEGESLNSWIVDALRFRLGAWEIDHVRDEIALEEIEREILIKGQTAPIPVDGPADMGHCDMCLQEIVLDPLMVDGPHFCTKCLEISKGGDFSELAT